jgi:Tol biopolymer transport system component
MQVERKVRALLFVSAAIVWCLLAVFLPDGASATGQSGKIVFVGGDSASGSFQLFTMNPDGTAKVQITNLPANNFDSRLPNISPDGQRVIFCFGTIDANNNPHADLYVVNIDGTGLVQLTNDGVSCFPRWSPDGTQIIFAQLAVNINNTTISNNVVATMHANGTGTTLSLTSDLWDSIGFFTPDERHVVFYSQAGGLISAVWIMNANGANKRQLTPAALEGFPSDVSPDSQHILLGNHGNSGPALTNDIFVMNLDGTGLSQLTQYATLHHDGSGSYSPDGTKIVFSSDRLSADVSATSFGTYDIFTMNADGSNVTRIATAVASCPQDGNCPNVTWGPKP